MANERTQLNIKIDPKIHWLASLCARHQALTLADFVERAITAALDPATVAAATQANEPNPSHSPAAPKPLPHLWGEHLWDDDEAKRLFLLATRFPDFAEMPQIKLWTRITAEIAAKGKKLNSKTFSEHYYAAQSEGDSK